ncbi:MAG: NusG domain II-containing protein [bacterium]
MAIRVLGALTWGDKILILLLILINLGSLFLLTGRGKSSRVTIQAGQKVIGIYDLDSSPRRVVPVPGPLGSSEVEIREGKVRMLSSPCPNQVCTRAGWIDHQGQIICCVPNQVLIRISGDKANDPSLHLDGVAR